MGLRVHRVPATAADLTQQMERALPRRAPSWTDHNRHDPGITIVELIAGMLELDGYRMTRTPPATLRSLLRLAGIVMRPATPAVVELVLSAEERSVTVPRGTAVGRTPQAAEFSTEHELHVTASRLVTIRTVDERGHATDVSDDASFHPFGADPRPGAALHLGFDAPFEVDRVSLHAWTTADAELEDTERDRIVEEGWRRVWRSHGCSAIDLALDDARTVLAAEAREQAPELVASIASTRSDGQLAALLRAMAGTARASLARGLLLQHYEAKTVWEARVGERWAPLGALMDHTRALTLSGAVRFDAMKTTEPAPDGLRWIRCRLTGHRPDASPFACSPRLSRIGLNVVSARHAVVWSGGEVVPTGRAAELLPLPLPSERRVLPGSVRLTATSGLVWRDAPALDTAGPQDPVIVLLEDRRRVVTGDGRSGRVPTAGEPLSVSAELGGGTAGNLRPESLRWVDVGRVHLSQPYAARGGTDAETLADAQARAVQSWETRHRAATLGDLEALAVETPGVEVARARALAEHHPDHPGMRATGCVTVVVLPRCPKTRPVPSPAFLRAVCRHLSPRRPVATELHVVAPCLVRVHVGAVLHVGHPVDATTRAAALRTLDELLDPSAWPIGRHVYRNAVLAALQGVPGVRYVSDLVLHANDDPTPACDNLCVGPDCVVVSGDHHLTLVDQENL